ncbi:MAG: hypothetical protein IJW23_05660 [Lentisphaeria bacterium]|nr:hypothetical protein [Lentisphaeria bacterium]
MTEKEKNVLQQELWALAAIDADATKHLLEISTRQIKCITREDANEMTPDKHKVVEEMHLQWSFVKKIREDLFKIAEKLDHAELIPELPQFVICDELWDVENSGRQSLICDVSEKIGDFQSSLMDALWKLQEYCK